MEKKKLISIVVLLIIALFLFVSCGSGEYWSGSRWRDSEPEKQGMDPELLAQITSHVKEELPRTTSVLVIRNGYIVFEEYYKGDKKTQRGSWSITNAVTSALIGIAIDQGIIENLDQKMIDFFPEFESEELNSYVRNITIRHLLTMTSGFNDTISTKFIPKEMKNMLESSDHLPPGSTFSYNDNCAHLLSMIITKATGDTLEEYGRKHLFGPLGIAQYTWNGAYGFTFGADALYLTSRDMAKLGFLYIKGGTWGKKQIVPSEWVKDSTQRKVDLPQELQSRSGEGYGFQWWMFSTHSYSGYMAAGLGGPYLCVVPDLGLVIVITSEDFHSRGLSFKHLSILDDYVVPAIIK
jgi:CubicO group peptidase (beta-lactamase class C family)